MEEIPDLRNEIDRLNEELEMKDEELQKRMEDSAMLLSYSEKESSMRIETH